MAANTKIEWATHTFSPWIGCSKVRTGCQNCYAEAMAGQLGVTWGPNGTRRRTAESTWKQVEKWNRAEEPFLSWSNHERPRVFPSLCDPFEEWLPPVLVRDGYTQSMDFVRRDFLALIDRCLNLDFLLLTKRPENVRRMWPELVEKWPDGPWRRAGDQFRRNVWLLYSASYQASLEAGAEHLRACRDLCPVQGFSLEPLLGPVLIPGWCDWIVCGGESGPRARPLQVEWVQQIADQCEELGIPLFCKQDSGRWPGQQGRLPDHLWSLKQFPGRDAGC